MIAITVAFKQEAKFLLNKLNNLEKISIFKNTFYRGTISNKNIVIAILGIGKIDAAATTQLLISTFSPQTILHIGVAGGISPDVTIGDMILASEVILHDYIIRFPSERERPTFKTSVNLNEKILAFNRKNNSLIYAAIVSGDEDVITTDRKNELFKKHNALSTDWESGAAVAVANKSDIINSVIRIIVDSAHEESQNEFKDNLEAVTKKLNNFIFEFISNNQL